MLSVEKNNDYIQEMECEENKRHTLVFENFEMDTEVNNNQEKNSSNSSSFPPPPSNFPEEPVIEEKSATLVRRRQKSPENKVQERSSSCSKKPPSPKEKKIVEKTEDQQQHNLPPVPRTKRIKPEAYRYYLEQHIENIENEYKLRKDRRLNLEQKFVVMNMPADEREQIRSVLYTKETQYLRRKRQKMDKSNFTWVKTLGVGAFGEVALARKNDTGEIFAIKTLKKEEVVKKKQVAHVKAERDILASADCPWIPRLLYAFHDKDHLYFVTEYVPGGDLMSLLIKMEIFKEDFGKFYTAELVLALEYVHGELGYIHRDIKPDNILIDSRGHIKLADFGLCTGFR